MKKSILQLLVCVALGVLTLTGCGGSSNTSAPDPNALPEAQTAVFQRICDRVNGLIKAKDFAQAQKTLDVLKDYKLTAEQQQVVDKIKAEIPKTN